MNPRCGVTRRIGNTDWICVLPPHATIYQRRTRPGVAYGNNPRADRHYFVNRYPNRDSSTPTTEGSDSSR